MENTLNLDLRLHEGQLSVFNDPCRFIILVAGRRWGKTQLAITKIVIEALKESDRRIWYVSPLYRQSKDIAWKLLKTRLHASICRKINESELTITLVNGSEIALKGADNPESLLGVGLHYVVLDEYGSMKQDVWQETVRPMLTDTLGKALFIGTPRGKNHFWELFVMGQRGEHNYKSYHYKTIDNPFIDKGEIDTAREQLDPRFFKQEYEASFEDFTGLVYPEFSREVHVLNMLPQIQGLTCLVAIDPALTGTFAWLQAYVDNTETFYIVKEYYEKDKRVDEIVASLPKKVDRYLIDPNFGSARLIPREGKMFSFMDEFRRFGVPVRLAEEDVIAGVSRVRQFLHTNKIKIFHECKNLIWELERYHYPKERETSLGVSEPKPYKKDDHLCMTQDTKIHTVTGDIPIKELVGKSGYVYSYNGKRICVSRFKEVRKTGKDKEVWKVTYTDGQSIKATPNHPFMLRTGEYKPLRELKIGDSLMPFYKRIDSRGIAKIEFYGYEDVYNMTVEKTHNFAADGVIVHNCDSLRYLIMSRASSDADEKEIVSPHSLEGLLKQDSLKKAQKW